MEIVIGIVGLLIGAAIMWYFAVRAANSRYIKIVSDAEKDSEVILKNKLVEAREETLKMRSEAEKEINSKTSRIQSTENRLKQREITLNQRQNEVNRKRSESDSMRSNLDKQIALLEKRSADVEKTHREAVNKLETVSGLSAEEAKEQLVESLREEAKISSQSYVNDMIEEAKLTANREAKRIVIQSIQRVATETAVENAITVFHIDSDEIKGRIIGREGRNIRALEAATGVEIIVD
ncbi:MAG: DUF3552 domain-containing protein, partial [Bacteroidales bacterium]|nr:DUF3552 domain-containing protein [Bacteroidales bacterium]